MSLQTPTILLAQLHHHCWVFCRSSSLDGDYGYFLSCYLCWEFECAPIYGIHHCLLVTDLFQALATSCFPCSLRLLSSLSEFLCIVNAADVGLKKEREIPCVRHLALSWHACALQLTQQSPNACRARFQSLAVNHWSIRRELGDPQELCCTPAWWPRIPVLQCLPCTLPMLFSWDRSYFAWLETFQTILNSIFSELGFGSALFE